MSGWTIEIQRPCPACKGGTDRPFRQWCAECDRVFESRELRNIDTGLPCGHSIDMLREEGSCVECEDTGIEYRRVTLWELAAIAAEEATK